MVSKLWLTIIMFYEAYLSFAMLRKDSKNMAVFMAETGMTLKAHVLFTRNVTSPFDCAFHCTSTPMCRSYNYKTRGPGIFDLCQLNNATKKTAQAFYIKDVDYVHYFDQEETFKSCVDHLRYGATTNGIYTISDTNEKPYEVYCDLTTEPRSAWTLIQSCALKNYPDQRYSFLKNIPVNSNNPNWPAYRLSLERMKLLSQSSTHTRSTTGFEKYGVDYRDYLRFKIATMDILNGSPSGCRMVEYINIRGLAFYNVSVPFFSTKGQHIDSNEPHCDHFNARKGSVNTEDNFGHYVSTNPLFRGSEGPESTTQWWFGEYLRD